MVNDWLNACGGERSHDQYRVFGALPAARRWPALKPIYDDYSFGNIPNTIEYLLTGRAARPAAAGRLLRRRLSAPARRSCSSSSIRSAGSSGRPTAVASGRRAACARDGTLTPISALFPSTTAASVSTMNLGVLPCRACALRVEHLHPRLRRGDPVAGLLARSAATRRMPAVRKGYDPGKLLEVHETVHQRLGGQGVRSIQFAHRSYADSAYNTVASVGREDRAPQHDGRGAGAAQGAALAATTGKALAQLLLGRASTRLRTRTAPAPATTPPRSRASGARSTRSSAMWRAPTRSISSPPTTATSTPTRGDDLYQRAHSRAGRMPAGEPHRQSDLSQRLAARCLPARAAGAPRRRCWRCCTGSSTRWRWSCRWKRCWPRGCSARGPIGPGAAAPARRHPDPALSRQLHLVARAGPHAERLLRPPRRAVAARS